MKWPGVATLLSAALRYGVRVCVIVVAALLLAEVFLTFVQHCTSPLRYKIGMVDPRFGVSTSTFEKDIKQAGAIWSIALDRTLFEYDPEGGLTINLVYDARQEKTEEANVLVNSIKAIKDSADNIKAEYSALEESYRSAQADYEIAVAGFNDAAAQYQEKVAYWNARGGAPESEFSALTSEKNALAASQDALKAKRAHVTELAGEINAMIDKYNLLVSHINTSVSEINNNGLTGTSFEEGVYVSDAAGEHIDIYQFQNHVYFIRVLAHELGHALGLPHNSNQKSIMSPVNQVMSLKPSADDLAALKDACSDESNKSWSELWQDFVKQVRKDVGRG